MNKKEQIQARIKELEAVLDQQTKLSGQVERNIMMLHGSIEELKVWVRKIEAEEAQEAEKARLEAEKQAEAVILDSTTEQ